MRRKLIVLFLIVFFPLCSYAADKKPAIIPANNNAANDMTPRMENAVSQLKGQVTTIEAHMQNTDLRFESKAC